MSLACDRILPRHIVAGSELLAQVIRCEKNRLFIQMVDGIKAFLPREKLLDHESLPEKLHTAYKKNQWLRVQFEDKLPQANGYPKLVFSELPMLEKPILSGAKNRLKDIAADRVEHSGQRVEGLVALITYKDRHNKYVNVNGTQLQPKQSHFMGIRVVVGKQIGFIPASCVDDSVDYKVGDSVIMRSTVYYETPLPKSKNMIFTASTDPEVVDMTQKGFIGEVPETGKKRKREGTEGEDFGKVRNQKKVKLDEDGVSADMKKSNIEEVQEDIEQDEEMIEQDEAKSKSSSDDEKAGSSSDDENSGSSSDDEKAGSSSDDEKAGSSSDDENSGSKEEIDEAEPKAVTESVSEEESESEDVEKDESMGDLEIPELDASDDAESDSSSNSDEEAEVGTAKVVKLTPSEKKMKSLEAQEATRSKERQVADLGLDSADSIEDYERLVMTLGKQSAVWIQYMAHHLTAGSIDKARLVSERALGVVPLAAETERLDLWMAMFSVEVNFGTRVSREEVLKRALERNDPREVFVRCATIYFDALDYKSCLELLSRAAAKFPHNLTIWKAYIQRAYATVERQRKGKKNKVDPRKIALEQARKVGEACKTALRDFQKDQITMAVEVAKAEYNIGEIEQGTTNFDSILSDFGKRTDLWVVYLDCVIKCNTAPIASTPNALRNGIIKVRRLFVRAIGQVVKPSKVLCLYKKWLSFEKLHGNEEGATLVKKQARKFVEESKTSL